MRRKNVPISAPPRILFVSHSASRNGATILLLHLLRWLRKNAPYRIEILLLGGGELVSEFREIGPTTVLRSLHLLVETLHLGRLGKRLQETSLHLRLLGRSYDLVYINTAVGVLYVPFLASRASAVLWHIHELEYVLRLSMTEDQSRAAIPCVTRFVAVSEAVKSNLTRQFGVAPAKIDLVHGFSPLPVIQGGEVEQQHQAIRTKLGWDTDTFVVGGCGVLGWRKGSDIFIQIAAAMLARGGQEKSRFLWVGGGSPDEVLRFEHDVRSFHLQGRCCYVSSQANMTGFYQAMDVFALTSREDPFPLVLLEAGANRLPIVCFADSGGASEFVSSEIGFTAPYLAVQEFADYLDLCRRSPELRTRLGAAAAEQVTQNYTVDVQGPKLQRSIEECLASEVDSRHSG